VKREDEIGQLHLRTSFNNICRKDVPDIRRWLIVQAKEFHKRARDYLSIYDKDINPDLMGNTEPIARISLSSFSFAADIEEPTPDNL